MTDYTIRSLQTCRDPLSLTDAHLPRDEDAAAPPATAPGTAIEAAGGTVHWLVAHDRSRLRLAHWPKGERGVVLLLTGRAEFIEKYLETVEALQSRGFAVWTLDWRGQGASSRSLPDRLAHHVLHFDQYLSDLSQVLDQHVVPSLGHPSPGHPASGHPTPARRPLVMLAHSMGGHIGAHMLSRRGDLFERAILLAPMIEFLRGGPATRWAARLVVQAMCLLPGRALRFGPGMAAQASRDPPFENNRLTTCRDRHAANVALLRASPEMALGGVTWGWIRAALASIARLRDPRVLVRINMHVLVVMAGDERVVDNRAMRRFALRLQRGKMVKIDGARHELLREQDRHRALVWQAIDAFLEPLG